MTSPGGYPDPDSLVQAVREWTGLSVSSAPDEMVAQVILSEEVLQSQRLRLPVDEFPANVLQALYRRCARQFAARGVPLGLAGLESEFGASRLPAYDAEIERLEAPFLVVVVA
jgi:hypothetical protein